MTGATVRAVGPCTITGQCPSRRTAHRAGVLLTALATNPRTPAAMVAALATMPRRHLRPDHITALVTHPALPADHPLLGDVAALGALCRPELSDAKATAIAAQAHLPDVAIAAGDQWLHPAAAAAFAARRADPEYDPSHIDEVLATNLGTPAHVAVPALARVVRRGGIPAHVALLAATRHAGGGAHPPTAWFDPALAGHLRRVAGAPDLHRAAIDVVADEYGLEALREVLEATGDPDVAEALLDRATEFSGWAAHVMTCARLDPRLRVRAMRQVLDTDGGGGPGHGTAVFAAVGEATLRALDDEDVLALADADVVLPAMWPDLVSNPDLAPETLTTLWHRALHPDALGHPRAAGVLVELAGTIAAHPATPHATRDEALARSVQALRNGGGGAQGALSWRVLAGVHVFTAATDDKLLGFSTRALQSLEDIYHKAVPHLTARLSRIVEPHLAVFADPPVAAAAAGLLPDFAGSFTDLVTVATTVGSAP